MTAKHQRRAFAVYVIIWIVGLLPALTHSAPLQTFGLGLWFPGGGYLAQGEIIAFLTTITLFGLAVLAWFWAGMVIAPIAVWVGAAVAAALIAQEPLTSASYMVVFAAMSALVLTYIAADAIRESALTSKRNRRNAFLAHSLAQVRERAANPQPEARELTPDQLAHLRYIYDRALQPVEQFGGFNIIEQFQPASLRYQLNHMGFALGVAQSAYLPSFTGYHAEAQNNLIQKYLLRRVWSYWIYESMWGHLNFKNFDPAQHDNIMLTGWFGLQVGQYMTASGDRRYAEPGSLAFKLNTSTTYTHSFKSLAGSIVANYSHYKDDFCLYPCEPNWIYPLCNHYGMAALAAHDHLFGTDHVTHLLPRWLEKLETEFTDSAGTPIGLRSKHLGLEFPFPVWEADLSRFTSCFAPDLAQRQWAIARKEIEPRLKANANGKLRIKLPGPGADPGNYGIGHGVTYCGHLIAAREFGDTEIAEAAQQSLGEDCGLDDQRGVRRYLKASNLINAQAALGSIMQTGAFRRSVVEAPTQASRTGPILAHANYPEVLVAHASSDGTNLNLVLYPGKGDGPQTLTLARLNPGARYRIEETESEFVADSRGTASIAIGLRNRTSLAIRNVASTGNTG
ncbi:MAG: hypothetical protein HOP13_04810 [Alphaproteobacteria bacterium]|nr:hypothetical protein [Alphaproteobacteria bacterium]